MKVAPGGRRLRRSLAIVAARCAMASWAVVALTPVVVVILALS
ncbi:hypothetical protein [Rhizosaccharibacter radicis]